MRTTKTPKSVTKSATAWLAGLCAIAIALLLPAGSARAQTGADDAPADPANGGAAAGAAPVEPTYWGNVDRPVVESRDAADPDFAWLATWHESPMWGGRMGYVDENGNLKVTLRYDPSTPWVIVAKKVRDFQLMDWRLAILTEDGRLLFSVGELNQPFREIDKDVTAFQMTLTRVGSIHADGTLVVKDEGFKAQTVATGVKAFQVTYDGHMGVLGFDGSFYVQHGTTPESAHLVARDVTSFQVEREWVAYVQRTKGGSRLMVGKEQSDDPWHKIGDFAPVAADVSDFEAQVEVAFAGPEMQNSRLHLAAVRKGELTLFDGRKPALLERTIAGPGHRVSTVHWAGARLAALGTGGELSVAPYAEDGPRQFQQLGKVAAFRVTVEGTALLARDGASMSLLEIGSAPAPPALREGSTEEEKAAVVAEEAKAARTRGFDLADERDLVTRRSGARKAGSIGLSSMRPEFTRRPVGLSVDAATPAGSKAVSFKPAETVSAAPAVAPTSLTSLPLGVQ